MSCDCCIATFGFLVPLVEVDIGLLADQVGVAATDTLYTGEGIHDLLLAIDLYIVSAWFLIQDDRYCRTLVLSRRKMNWKFDFSPVTRDMMAVVSLLSLACLFSNLKLEIDFAVEFVCGSGSPCVVLSHDSRLCSRAYSPKIW